MKITTVRLPEGLLAQAKKLARQRGVTVTALVEEGLRDVVSRKRPPSKKTLPPVSSVYGTAPPDIDIANSAKLQELLDDDVILQAGLVKLR
ncbi:MAG: hypothetical protein U5J99_00880 [Parvularculaceae bacterium]|nr:hypothetical protein [Parvularculaceae bacterium]